MSTKSGLLHKTPSEFLSKLVNNENYRSKILIDIHSHVLPKIDDGPVTWEDTMAMLRQAGVDINELVS